MKIYDFLLEMLGVVRVSQSLKKKIGNNETFHIYKYVFLQFMVKVLWYIIPSCLALNWKL